MQKSSTKPFIDEFRLLAKDGAWTKIVWHYDRNQIYLFGAEVDLKAHWNVNDDAWSVMTTLKHPQQGKTVLWRNHMTPDEVKRVIMYPREHTGKGHIIWA